MKYDLGFVLPVSARAEQLTKYFYTLFQIVTEAARSIQMQIDKYLAFFGSITFYEAVSEITGKILT